MKQYRFALAFLGFQVIAQTPSYPQDAESLLNEAREKVAGLEAAMEKIAAAVSGQAGAETTCFNWALQNELRHFYAYTHPEKSFYHCDVILRNSVMDGYILSILANWADDRETQVKNLIESADRYPKFAFISAACALRAAKLTPDAALRQKLLNRVVDLNGDGLEPYISIARTMLKTAADEPR